MIVQQFKIGSLLKKTDRDEAALEIFKGGIVGIFNRGVCALWFDGSNILSVKKIWKIKGEGRKGRPIALTLDLEEFVSMIDVDLLPENLQNLIKSPDFKSRVGSLCFIRAPLGVKHLKNIPEHAKSFEADGVCMIQNWDAYGHTPTDQFLRQVRNLGIKFPAVTSMNITGQREIVNQKEGIKFCKKYDIPIFLKDPKAHPKHMGSYTIFTFGKGGIKLERDGNIPASLFKKIFGLPFDNKNVKKPNYPQLKFSSNLRNLTGVNIRQAIILYLQGGL